MGLIRHGNLMEGNGHFRASKLLKMMMLRRVRHTAISRFGSSFLGDKNLYFLRRPEDGTVLDGWRGLRS